MDEVQGRFMVMHSHGIKFYADILENMTISDLEVTTFGTWIVLVSIFALLCFKNLLQTVPPIWK